MSKLQVLITGASCLALASVAAAGDGWVNFNNETGARLVADPSLGVDDTEEKDYAWGDVDNDGDIDLVCVRKQEFTSAGRRANVLFMNEGVADGQAIDGVLVDRTALYASAADDGGNGFLDNTNDRDVQLADFDGDGWLDIVTATTLSDGQPKTISHPRIYMNLGEIEGVWQGFRYEEARTPQIFTHPAGDAVAPRFCSVAVGDVTGDGRPDLYFGDYDSSGAGGVGQPAGLDVNNRLFVNNGSGFFTDDSQLRMGSQFNYPGVGNRDYLFSAFGAASAIVDMNGDGHNDVVKQTSLAAPTHVAIVYNDEDNVGFFDDYDFVYDRAPYFISVDDLNGDGLMDIVLVDDGTDRYLLNQGTVNGRATFGPERQFDAAASAGFGGNSWIADLNKDGNNDVLITDVDVDIGGCSRRMHIYRNLGNVPNVDFQEQGEVIPNGMLQGTHDVAVFDINGDTWLDLVVGRCSSTEIWINQPPSGLVFSYPNGQPAFVSPDATFELDVQVNVISGGQPVPGTGKLFYSVDGGPFIEQSMNDLGGDLYRGTLPAVACTSQIRYYVEAEQSGAGTFTDPQGAPVSTHSVIASSGVDIAFRDEIEGDVSGWLVENDASLTSGAWEQADPNLTLAGNGQIMSPGDDATNGAANVQAFVTENGVEGGGAGATDVDGGPTHLISPVIDLAGTDATISFDHWFSTTTGDTDQMTFAVSNDNGSSWTPIPELTTSGTGEAWEQGSFVVSDYVTPTASVRVRFTASDSPNDSLTEAGVDNFQVSEFLCPEPPSCASDIASDGSSDPDGTVDTFDLLLLLADWGASKSPADIAGDGSNEPDGIVDTFDLLLLLSEWGACD